MARVIGIDPGTKRVGIAVGDTSKGIAFPLATIPYRSCKQVKEAILTVCREENVSLAVIGVSRNRKGELTAAGRIAMKLRELLEPSLEVEFTGEEFSTVDAETILVEADISRNKRKKAVDRIAAAILLKGFLDRYERTVKDDD